MSADIDDVTEWQHDALVMIGAAVRAPSSHNTQPWRFRVADRAIDLLADRTRALPVNDPQDRELTISCGCALMNLRVMAAHRRLGCDIQLLPEPEEPDLLARISFSSETGGASPDTDFYDAIDRRRTYRRRFVQRNIDAEAVRRLREAAHREGAWLRPVQGGEQREAVAQLVAEGDAAQWSNPHWRRELAAWLRPRPRGDGLSVPAVAAPLARLVIRAFNIGGSIAAKDRQLAQDAPLLAVLGTDADGPPAWLTAGQALQRVLLVACKQGLQAAYLNQPVQIAALRPRLQDIVAGGAPQILLRLGYPEAELSASPRRPPEAVVERVDARPAA